MLIADKKQQLENIIKKELVPLIDRDYVLLSLPCHSNIGDTLIYEGEKDFLKRIPYRCIFKSSTYDFDDRYISPETLILFHGGGNFGDIYEIESNFKSKIVSKYPNNKIVFFPQTVYYQNESRITADAELFKKCKDLTICARDKYSYEILSTNFDNRVILVPDMAFCIDNNRLFCQKPINKCLFLKRTDEEMYSGYDYTELPLGVDIHDWPTREYTPPCYWLDNYIRHIISLLAYMFGKACHDRVMCSYKNYIWERFIFPYNVKTGIQFISKYETIYTTRLHGAILGILLNREIYLYDNSYGKNSTFYLTWLEDVERINLILSNKEKNII